MDWKDRFGRNSRPKAPDIGAHLPPDVFALYNAFAGTLALVAVMIPLIVNRAALVGVLVAAVTAVLAFKLPYRLGLLVAVVLGMGAAMMVDSLQGTGNKEGNSA